jgi:hypothetical protein
MYKLEQLMVLDIETVSAAASFHELSPAWQELWVEKYSKTAAASLSAEESYSQRAAIMAEFGKIICISTGFFHNEPGKGHCLRLKTWVGEDEKQLLNQFVEICDRFAARQPAFFFAGHNIKEFDIPYLCRRMMHHHIPLPQYLQLHGKKPWETQMLDTLELWKFGDYKSYTSLKLLCASLDIPTSKDDIDGSKVGQVFYVERNMQKIADYCGKDVVAVAQILLRFSNLPLLLPENIALV